MQKILVFIDIRFCNLIIHLIVFQFYISFLFNLGLFIVLIMGLRKVFLIMYTNCTEISFAYDTETILTIKKFGATFSRSNKKWYISSDKVDDMITTLKQSVEIVIDELGFEKKTLVPQFDHKFQIKQRVNQPVEENQTYLGPNAIEQSNRKRGYDQLDSKENNLIRVLSKNGELRVKLNIAKDIYTNLMLLGCTRDYKNHELVFQDPDIFYNYCRNHNKKFIFV